jgi:hypothetical protein
MTTKTKTKGKSITLTSTRRKGPTRPYDVGTAYLIRTVTHYWIGRLVGLFPGELVLEHASWVAFTGRWGELFTAGTWSSQAEIEVMPADARVVVARGAIVDASPWPHGLPKVSQ